MLNYSLTPLCVTVLVQYWAAFLHASFFYHSSPTLDHTHIFHDMSLMLYLLRYYRGAGGGSRLVAPSIFVLVFILFFFFLSVFPWFLLLSCPRLRTLCSRLGSSCFILLLCEGRSFLMQCTVPLEVTGSLGRRRQGFVGYLHLIIRLPVSIWHITSGRVKVCRTCWKMATKQRMSIWLRFMRRI